MGFDFTCSSPHEPRGKQRAEVLVTQPPNHACSLGNCGLRTQASEIIGRQGDRVVKHYNAAVLEVQPIGQQHDKRVG